MEDAGFKVLRLWESDIKKLNSNNLQEKLETLLYMETNVMKNSNV